MSVISAEEWDKFVRQFPDAHILQTSAWGKLKSMFGWKDFYITCDTAGAMALFRKLPLGFSVGYIPKGPLGENWQSLWKDLDVLSRKNRAIFLKIEPDVWEDQSKDLSHVFSGFQPDIATTQPRRTILISLKGNEEEWLGRMKQKTRYNIRLAEKKGVKVQISNDLAAFSQMMQITGVRDGFGVHTSAYYERAYQLFHSRGQCEFLMAYYDGKPLAGLMLFWQGKRAWYLFGGSTDEERNRMPTYLLQWEAMRYAAQRGCEEYDLWGVPDESESILEERFEQEKSGLWGVYRFKRGFGGKIVRSSCAFERVYMPTIYKFYQTFLQKKGE